MDKALRKKLDKLHKHDQYDKIIEVVTAVPKEEWDAELIGRLASAHNNLEEYEEAIELLLSVKEEGTDDPLWHFRMGYAQYYLGNEEEAQTAFARTLELDPKDKDARQFLAWCTEHKDENAEETEESFAPEMYEEEEIEAVEAHISRYFGTYPNVFHELISPDIHVDIAKVDPTEERPYYTLVTMGMGAHRMHVPEELEGEKLERAELLICLPPDWKVQDNAEKWYWPLRWLKILARLPGQEDSWLGWGHSVTNGGPFSKNTKLSGMMLVSPVLFDEEAATCPLPNGEAVQFYQLLPIYDEEMQYKLDNNAEALLEKMDDSMLIVDTKRRNVC